jgi:hypothetical protein
MKNNIGQDLHHPSPNTFVCVITFRPPSASSSTFCFSFSPSPQLQSHSENAVAHYQPNRGHEKRLLGCLYNGVIQTDNSESHYRFFSLSLFICNENIETRKRPLGTSSGITIDKFCYSCTAAHIENKQKTRNKMKMEIAFFSRSTLVFFSSFHSA